MLKKKTLAPSLFFRTQTPTTTPELSPTSSDSDSEEDMESAGSRPVSLVGAFSMRPTLDEVLANIAPPPYTLSAFMAYLSQNHCLETLEFTMEANRYRESYYAIVDRLGPNALAAESPESQHMRMLWQRLLTAYIFPGSPREINISSEVRDALLQYTHVTEPPLPEILDSAVKRIHDLMEESIFLPFINSHTTSPSMMPSEPLMAPDDILTLSSSTLDEHSMNRVRSRVSKRISPQSSLKDLPTTGHSRSTMSLGAVHAIGKRTSGALLSTSAESASLTDDSSPQSSPTAEEPMTPPTTPPASEPHLPIQSPKLRTENPWKKMGMKLGFKKRSPTGSVARDPKILGLDE